jgi:EAL domain-containing protein (putative c-di-GMP-specific phosphodiesterase class I)
MQVNAFKLTNQDIDTAFEENQFRLIYQPQISTSGAKVMAAEAYVRWFHPNFGPIPPGLFLSYVYNQGRTRELTNFLLRQAVDATANWHRSGLNWVASVNIGLSDLSDGTLPLTLDILLREYGLEGWHLSLDIRETALATHAKEQWETISKSMRDIRELGVGIALECSGPESIPLDQLDATYFTQLKVGGASILQFAKSTRHLPFGFIQDRVRFAKENNLVSVAVGAEDAATLVALKQLGFDHVQGNAICPPIPLADLNEWRRTYVPPSLYIYGADDPDEALRRASASVRATGEEDPLEAPLEVLTDRIDTEPVDDEISLTVVGRPVGQKVVETTWQEADSLEDDDVLEIELTPSSAADVGLESSEQADSGGFLKGLMRRKIKSGD